MAKYYLRVEGVNLSSFVYDTQDLSTIRGGGLLLLDAVEWVKEWLQKASSVSNLTSISTGASMGLFSFESDNGEVIKRTIFDYLNLHHEQLKHATFVVAVKEYEIDNDFIKDKETLIARNRWQQMQSPSIAVPAQSSDNPCRIDMVRPAKEKYTDPDTPMEQKYISASVNVRRAYGIEQKRELYYKYNETAKQEQWKFVNDLDKLTEDANKDSLHHKMAVIYLDGNGFGKIRDNSCKTAGDEKEFNRQIKDYRKKMLSDLLHRMRNDNDWKNGDLYRIETLLWGGDELMWVVPAWKGWETLMFFYKQSSDWKFKNTKDEEAPLTHAGGIVFCHHNAPIYRIKNLAHKLSDVAKKKAKEIDNKNPPNLFAYQILESFDHISHDFDDIRKKWATDGKAESLILDGNNMEDIQKNINVLKDSEFPKSKLHEIIKKLRSGQNANDVIEKTIKGLSDNITNLINLNIACNGDKAKWGHITDLWNYII